MKIRCLSFLALSIDLLLAPAAIAGQLTSREAEELREALIYSASVHHFPFRRLDKATSCMMRRLTPGLGGTQFRWVVRYYRNELSQAAIDADPYNMLDWLSDTAGVCLKAARR